MPAERIFRVMICAFARFWLLKEAHFQQMHGMIGAGAPILGLAKDTASVVEAAVEAAGVAEEPTRLGTATPTGRVEGAAVAAGAPQHLQSVDGNGIPELVDLMGGRAEAGDQDWGTTRWDIAGGAAGSTPFIWQHALQLAKWGKEPLWRYPGGLWETMVATVIVRVWLGRCA